MKFSTVAVVSSLVTAALAFEHTVPCLMWSPKEYVLSSWQDGGQLLVGKDEALPTILSALSGDVCDAKVIAVVDQPGVHRSDLWRHSQSESFATLKKHHDSAVTRQHIEYISGRVDVEGLAERIAAECDSTLSAVEPSTLSTTTPIGHGVKLLQLPEVDSIQTLSENDALLGRFIQAIQNDVQDDYVIIYTSSVPQKTPLSKKSKFHRRGPPSTKAVNPPIFAKYQLFTPGIFMAIGVASLVLFVIAVGVTWLIGIQTPVRFEGKPKKN